VRRSTLERSLAERTVVVPDERRPWNRRPSVRIVASVLLMLNALGWVAAMLWWLREDPGLRPWWFYVLLGVLTLVVVWLLTRAIRDARNLPR
jgi:hypothetical protein